MIVLSDPTTEKFRSAIQAAGLTPPDEIQGNGALHRFSTNGKAKDDSGWYVLHGDGIPAGAFGCWREGFTQQWCGKSTDTMTPAEREAHRQRVEAMRHREMARVLGDGKVFQPQRLGRRAQRLVGRLLAHPLQRHHCWGTRRGPCA